MKRKLTVLAALVALTTSALFILWPRWEAPMSPRDPSQLLMWWGEV